MECFSKSALADDTVPDDQTPGMAEHERGDQFPRIPNDGWLTYLDLMEIPFLPLISERKGFGSEEILVLQHCVVDVRSQAKKKQDDILVIDMDNFMSR
ncbi:hypothetical protein NPIL_35391 [Nephila pilipes]|uniref:Uncharacterized protein n=1 Tax=Nephila pilipes TaxID=299642 RepID=A0A8X6Q2C5_NEPPI|nr:hypothetical protein NPIL_35391 [Nephila pilipes]